MDRLSRRPMTFYKNHGLISRYPEKRINNVVAFKQFNEIRDSLTENNIINWSFFDVFADLFKKTPKRNLMQYSDNENSDFSDGILGAKNSYLSMVVIKDVDNVIYSLDVRYNCNNVFTSLYIYNNSSNIFESCVVIESQNIFFSRNILNCYAIWSSRNLIWCSECINCDWLENKSYCINNQEYEKWEYMKIKLQYLSELSKNNWVFYDHNYINFWSFNSGGSFVHNCDWVSNWFMVSWVKNWRNLLLSWSPYADEECYDSFIVWRCKHIYGCEELGNFSEYIYISTHVFASSNCYYCFDIDACSFCLGCIWLKNKSYCILNKQYTKEERYEKVDEIFWQMEKDGTLGEFFPATMNPFYFNDTAAYLIDPSFTKEEVTARWYLRRDEPIKVDIPEWAKVVKTSELERFESFDSEWNWKVDSEILKYIIQDEQGNVYRIVKMEYDFLMKHGLPLPRKHWLDRMKENFRIC